jgi:phage terminase small subunit
MSRGRKKQSDAILKIKGTFRKDREQKTIKLIPFSGLPACPVWVNDTGKRIYCTQGPGLLNIKQLNEFNLSTFITYCQITGKLFELEKELEKLKNGSYSKHDKESLDRILALERLSTNLVKNIRSLASEFGLTPASAGRAFREPEKEPSKLEIYMQKYSGT